MEIYLLKSAACLGIFYVFYKIALEQQAMHTFKRFYLLGSVLASCIIPLITLTTYVEVAPIVFTATPMVSEITLTTPLEIVETTTNYLPIILWSIYGLGVLIFSSIFFRNIFQMIQRIKKNQKKKSASFFYLLLQASTIPHTFFNYIFLNKGDFEKGNIPKEVLLHEEAHASQKHSIDILCIEILNIVFWFNPVVWLYKRSIKLNHEFLADRAVLNKGADAYTYSNILLAFSSTASTPPLAHSINYSSIKKRLTIMKTTASKRAILLRSIVLLPLLALLIYGFSTTQEVERTISKQEVTTQKPILKIAIDGTTIKGNDTQTTLANFSNTIDNVTKKWSKEDFKLYLLDISLNNTTEEFKNKVNRTYRTTTLAKQANSKSDFLTTPPAPPSPISFNIGETLDHIVLVSKKNGTFIYNNTEISSDDAIALVKSNPKINLYTKNFDSGIPLTTFQDAPLNFDNEVPQKIFKLTVDFTTVIINGKISSLETFKEDVNIATKNWTEKDFKSNQPRTNFTNTSESFLNNIDKEFKKTKYSKLMGGMSIFWPHFECKPSHLQNSDGYPIVTDYKAKSLSKKEIIKKLKGLEDKTTSYRTNNNSATIYQTIDFVNNNNIRFFEVLEYKKVADNDYSENKKTVYLDSRSESEKRKETDLPPPPPAPKVLKGEKSNIPPPPVPPLKKKKGNQ